jgi:hypothetical protein
MGMFENTCRPAKNDPVERVLEMPLPPRPPRKTIHNLPKTSPHQDFSHQCVDPGIDSWVSPIYESTGGPHRGFVSGANKRLHVNTVTIKNTHLNPSCHHTDTVTVTRPTSNVSMSYNGLELCALPPRSGGQPAYPPFLTPARTGLRMRTVF